MGQKGFSNILLGIVLAIILIGAGSYLVITNKSNSHESPKEIVLLQENTGDSGEPYTSKLSFCGEDTFDQQISNHQMIWGLDITPRVVSATKATKISVDVKIGDSTTLIPESVELLRFNEKEEAVKSYGTMEDRGRDTREKNQHVFHSEITLNEPLPTGSEPWRSIILLGVVAEYKGLPCKAISNLLSPEAYISVVPSAPSPQEMFAQLADELERRDFDAVQKHFTDKPRNQKVRKVFGQMNEMEIRDFADGFRNAKLKTDYDGQAQWHEAIFTDEDGVRGPSEIYLIHSGNGEWLIDSL